MSIHNDKETAASLGCNYWLPLDNASIGARGCWGMQTATTPPRTREVCKRCRQYNEALDTAA